MIKQAAVLCLLAGWAFGQITPNVPKPTNLDFRDGEIGQLPTGWEMDPHPFAAGYRAELREHDCGRFLSCVAYVNPPVIGEVRAAEISQAFPAEPYIGKSVRFSAWLRLQEGKPGAYIHIRVRVLYKNRPSIIRDSVEPSVTGPEWQHREVVDHVDPGAVTILIWARYVPKGSAWVAEPSFEVIDEKKTPAVASFGVATSEFPLKDAAGKTVRYSGWIKTENVSSGYAGLWWRVDGANKGEILAFDNSAARIIEGVHAGGDGTIRGATGTTDWRRYEIELPVPAGATNINFGLLFNGTGTAWFDSLRVELNGVPYVNPQYDFEFESPTPKGFPFTGDTTGRYIVRLDNTTAFAGRQSLRMQFIGDRKDAAPVSALDPATVDNASRSMSYSVATLINFVNHSSTAVDIYWIDYSGNRVLKRSGLDAGSSWRTGTFLTHPWLVIAAGSGGTKEHDTGVRLAAFEATTSVGGDAIIIEKR